MNVHVLLAIFRRNFISYFSNPTGYVFICVFVLLSSFAAFWPNEFFNANLANLDQLNKWLPYILLVFIPAITMSIWAEERRLGTDELLLTIPAGDLEVVLGKYLAAVAIYSCSLVFSAISNLAVLAWLGAPDKGLFFGNYFGYWMVGLAMLSIGMVASFLTSNITVGFVLGAVFNTPLVFAAASDVVMRGDVANSVKRWSIEAAFRDFGRGVVSLSSVCYFALLTVVMLYVSVVLIGRRHWWGGRDGHAMLGHYLIRAGSLVLVAVGLTIFFTRHDVRADVTYEQLTALSPKTKELLKKLEPKDKVIIEAFVSPDMPETFVQTRLDLVNTLREMGSRASDKIEVRIHETEPYSEAAQMAEAQYDIKAERVAVRSSGAMNAKDVYLGVAVLSGEDKVIIPFFNRGIPIEYELIRSIATVGRSQDHRQKLGIIQTDADLEGGGGRRNMDPRNRTSGILTELRKQYEVETITPDRPIEKKFDVVLAVQPSSLTPPQMNNFIDLVKRGQPTAIFEDPVPVMGDFQGLSGTTDDPRPQDMGMGMFGGGMQPPKPKAKQELNSLWNLLGVKFGGDEVMWDRYNPYKHMQHLPKEFVFANAQSGGDEPAFRQDNPITKGLQEMGFVFAGWVSRGKDSGLTYTPLIFPSKQSGLVRKSDLRNPFGGGFDQRRESKYQPKDKNQALAAWIKGRLQNDLPLHEGHDDEGHEKTGSATGKADKDAGAPEINVVLVADADCLSSEFLMLRAEGNDSERELTFNFDNVTFVLNTLDFLAGDDRFIDIRSRRRQHRTLTEVEQTSEKSVTEAEEERTKFQKKLDTEKADAQKRFDDEIARIQTSAEGSSSLQMQQQIEMARSIEQKKLTTQVSRMEREFEQNVRKIDTQREQSIRRVRNLYKYVAVVLPPIFPLLIGVVVFFNRRAREREGVPEQRLRQTKAGG